MRIEINAGGMGKISVLSFEEAVARSIAVTASVIDSFVEIENDTYALNGGVGDCQDAVDSIDTRIQEESERLEEELAFHREVEDFIALAIRVDNEVANEIREAKEEFYQRYSWARPQIPEEKSWLDHLADGLRSVGEFLADVAKSVVDAIVSGISNFVEKNKEIFAFILDALGVLFEAAAFVASIAVIVAIAIVSAPLVAAVGVGAAIGVGIAAAIGAAAIIATLSASGCFCHGMADEVRENGGDFYKYDMNALQETCWNVWKESFISHSVQYTIAVIGSITGVSFSEISSSFFKLFADPAALSLGKRLFVQAMYKLPGEMVENYLSILITDAVDGDGIDIVEDMRKIWTPEELFFSLIGAGAGAYADELKDMNTLVDLANSVDVSTPKDCGIVYSGTVDIDGQKVRARYFAEDLGKISGKKTLEMTEGGKMFDNMDLYTRYPKEFADEIFGILSDRFSSQLSGNVTIVAENVNMKSMLYKIEIPNILEGIDSRDVTDLTFPLERVFKLIP